MKDIYIIIKIWKDILENKKFYNRLTKSNKERLVQCKYKYSIQIAVSSQQDTLPQNPGKETMSISSTKTIIYLFLIITLATIPIPVLARKPHIIEFRSPNLYPESLVRDPSGQHFLVGSHRRRIIASVSDAGVVDTFIHDSSLPENVTVLGLAVDTYRHRLLAVIHAMEPLPRFNVLAAYDLRTRQRIFLSILPTDDEDSISAGNRRENANDVAVDFKGNAYVTNSVGNYIWKVNKRGEVSIFSRSPQYTAHSVDHNTPWSFCWLNGIAYDSKGYFLVVQSNTGKMFKVDADDGTARLVLLNKDMDGADGIAIRRDGVVLVVSSTKLWYLKSQDNWGEGVVYDEIDLDAERFATSVVGEEDRAYVLYGHVNEGIMEGKVGRDNFGIEEVRSEKESGEDNVWIFVLVGLGLAYFLFWRFQMRRLMTNMDKKTT
ncbi:Six-bladed beta-propeller, TolB-like protein [Quillaja saponaria]|uniref:Six-bladed beta-propeller, TolB-like protein n=1 Tax=Quillaja saponaria TaxID=32244 RepID=A0AAD7LAG2_QUISA|nr:Six-bladed beta-propeller, TolB-like protein [Quillaja saponaria]